MKGKKARFAALAICVMAMSFEPSLAETRLLWGGPTGSNNPVFAGPIGSLTSTCQQVPYLAPKNYATGFLFNTADLNRVCASDKLGVVVAHAGVPLCGGFEVVGEHVEVAPVFVTAQNSIGNLTLGQLANILRGKTARWSEIGGRDVPVTIYRHGGVVETGALNSVLRTLGIAISDARVSARQDYDELARAAADDPGALVLGLRQVPAAQSRLKLLTIESVNPFSARWSDYPLKIAVVTAIRPRNPDTSAIIDEFAKRISARRAIDSMQVIPRNAPPAFSVPFTATR